MARSREPVPPAIDFAKEMAEEIEEITTPEDPGDLTRATAAEIVAGIGEILDLMQVRGWKRMGIDRGLAELEERARPLDPEPLPAVDPNQTSLEV